MAPHLDVIVNIDLGLFPFGPWAGFLGFSERAHEWVKKLIRTSEKGLCNKGLILSKENLLYFWKFTQMFLEVKWVRGFRITDFGDVLKPLGAMRIAELRPMPWKQYSLRPRFQPVELTGRRGHSKNYPNVP